MKRYYLNGEWILKNEKIGTVSASVPGCVHTDMINNGLIKDLYYRDNNKQYAWIENEDFCYSRYFDAPDGEAVDLVFEGLDTYCGIYLNGEHIGEADNMFHDHRFFIGGKLKKKDNLLEVRFRSPIKEVENEPLAPHGAFTKERMRTRRIQCTYGWDWVDRFVSCGIYRPVYIECGRDMHVDNAYIVTENIDAYSAQIRVELELKNYSNGALVEISVLSPNGTTVGSAEVFSREERIVRRFDIEEPELWYPLGYGEHPMYSLRVRIGDDIFEEAFGIRTLKILQIEDKEGSEYWKHSKKLKAEHVEQKYENNEKHTSFAVIVNGKRILCKGANWVPAEPFPSAETGEKFERLIDMAKDMGLNMLRVWGGGIFEDRKLYDACDRAGILVTQDFLMACGTYPEKEDWFIEHLKKEAEYAVKALRNHPSLAWWSGDNENAVKGSDDMEDYTGRDAALRGIAPLIYRYDPSRPFLPSSPYGGKRYMSFTAGTTHNTNFLYQMFVWFDSHTCEDYKKFLERFGARFIAEEPTFGAVSRRSALRFMSEDDLADDEQRILRFHTKNNPGLPKEIYDYVTDLALKVLGAAEDSEDRYFKYKYIQYEWVRVVFENLRRNIGYSDGIVFWMFNDCWPAALGWSFVDYYCVPKASYYSFRRCAKHVVSSVICRDGKYYAVISNDRDGARYVSGRIYYLNKCDLSEAVEVQSFSTEVEAYSASDVAIDLEVSADKVAICDIECEGESDRSFYNGGALTIRECTESLKVTRNDDGSLTFTSDIYIHAVEIEGDHIFSDNYFSLLPRESKTVTMKLLDTAVDESFTVTAYTLK